VQLAVTTCIKTAAEAWVAQENCLFGLCGTSADRIFRAEISTCELWACILPLRSGTEVRDARAILFAGAGGFYN
jgi:hypothetical protein